VICFGEGGATESVIDGRTGVHFWPQTSEALRAAVERFEASQWNPAAIRRHSLVFSSERFQERVQDFFRQRLSCSIFDEQRHRDLLTADL
jgi:hypothetical protein